MNKRRSMHGVTSYHKYPRHWPNLIIYSAQYVLEWISGLWHQLMPDLYHYIQPTQLLFHNALLQNIDLFSISMFGLRMCIFYCISKKMTQHHMQIDQVLAKRGDCGAPAFRVYRDSRRSSARYHVIWPRSFTAWCVTLLSLCNRYISILFVNSMTLKLASRKWIP